MALQEFIKRTFRISGQMPDHIFFDNNCSLAKHVKNDPDFSNVGLSVDVFHFSCKHSVTDARLTAIQPVFRSCLGRMEKVGSSIPQ